MGSIIVINGFDRLFSFEKATKAVKYQEMYNKLNYFPNISKKKIFKIG